MIVKDRMSRGLITVDLKTGLVEAWDLMRDRRIRHLLVMDGPKLVGIVSDRDIRLALPSPATSLSVGEINHLLAKLTVDRVMTPSPFTIAADRPLNDAISLMLEHRIGALPVLEGGGVCGIITQTDVLLAFPAATRESAQPVPPPAVSRHRILVPVDRTGHNAAVLAAAGELAKQASAIVRLMHVSPVPEPVVIDGRTVSYSDQEEERVEQEAEAELRAAAAELLKDVPVEYVVRLGNPAEEIVREAESVNADLIVMATHKRTGVRRLIQGSIAEDVERTTKLPVLLVPYDGDPEDHE